MEHFRGQIPINCQLCEAGNRIKWKCMDCDLLLCDRCKDNVHPKFKNAPSHNVINIKESGLNIYQSHSSDKCDEHPGQDYCLFCRTCDRSVCPICIAQIHNGHELIESRSTASGSEIVKSVSQDIKSNVKVDLRVIHAFATSLTAVENICLLPDNTLWINSGRFQELVKLRVDTDKLKMYALYRTNTLAIAMAHTSTNNVLYVTSGSKQLIQINDSNGNMTGSCYKTDPLRPTCVHVTRDDKVMIGARGGDKPFPATGRRVLIVMDMSGNKTTDYEHDNNNRSLFTYVYSICTTKNGCMGIVDSLSDDDRGRILFLGESGNVLNLYNGHPSINSANKPFSPRKIVATPSDNIISTEPSTDTLHIFNNSGQMITYFRTHTIDIPQPACLGFNSLGQLYIGCCGTDKRKDGRLFLVNISGC